MPHENEKWQKFDKSGERIFDGGITSAEKIPAGEKYGGVAVMLYRYRNDEIEFLFQHRSKNLKRNPGEWDVSAGGHINYKENLVDAILRETKEEIGVTLKREKLEFIARYMTLKRHFVCLYFYDFTNEKANFHFDDQEVEEVKWVKYSKFKDFISNLRSRLILDEVFLGYLELWAKDIRQKHGNLDK